MEHADAPISRVPGGPTDIDDLVPEPELEDLERPEWLPDKFKNPEALAEAYRHAEKKIVEQGQELAVFRDAQGVLEEELGQYQEAMLATTQVPDRQAELQSMQERAELAHGQTRQTPQYGPDSQLVAAEQGIQIATQHLGAENVGKAVDLFKSNLEWGAHFGQSLQGGPTAVAQTIAEAVKAMTVVPTISEAARMTEDTRAMKLQAQGITGGQAGRPDPATSSERAWERIRNAGGGYSDMMQREGR
jgi:hypothetical protein